MARQGTQNFPLTDRRKIWIESIGQRLKLDGTKHGDVNKIMDFALMLTYIYIHMDEARLAFDLASQEIETDG